jgi:ATP-binding cassette, subfamily C, bacterial EexD
MRSSALRGWARLIDRGAAIRLMVGGLGLTFAINAVGLVSPLFFTQVYDRVLTTGSVPTLIALVMAALIAIGIGAAFEQWRTVIFTRLGTGIYADLEARVFRASHALAVQGGQGRRGRPLDDLEMLRATLSSPLPGSLLDLAFAPILLAMLYLMDIWLGHFALFVLALMICVTVLTQWFIASSLARSVEASHAASGLAESHLRAAEAAAAMGYEERALDRWAARSRAAVASHVLSAAQAGGLTAFGRALRSGAQIAVIAIAAGLALSGGISPGTIIASSIITSRLIAPVDALLGGWRQLAQFRLAAGRLRELLALPEPAPAAVMLRPQGRLIVDGLTAQSRDGVCLLRGITFVVEPGETIAVLGPSGAGKSTLLRCLMGVWPHMAGAIRLDAIPLATADRRKIGAFMGYLPQSSDLAPGTIAENIARFGEVNMEQVVQAARTAGADQVIGSLPGGFDTEVGDVGEQLSSGQRRRIALARAVFGNPVLLCLDEPEANLDRDGELALASALQQLKAAGTTILIAAHRPSIVSQADKIMIVREGRLVQFGPASEILPTISSNNLRRVGV